SIIGILFIIALFFMITKFMPSKKNKQGGSKGCGRSATGVKQLSLCNMVRQIICFRKIDIMIKGNLLLCADLILANLSFAQKALIQKADLKNVTVFTSAAELNHTANIHLPSGSSEIVFTHVANNIDENSIQIGTGTHVTILSVRPALNYIDAER